MLLIRVGAGVNAFSLSKNPTEINHPAKPTPSAASGGTSLEEGGK